MSSYFNRLVVVIYIYYILYIYGSFHRYEYHGISELYFCKNITLIRSIHSIRFSKKKGERKKRKKKRMNECGIHDNFVQKVLSIKNEFGHNRNNFLIDQYIVRDLKKGKEKVIYTIRISYYNNIYLHYKTTGSIYTYKYNAFRLHMMENIRRSRCCEFSL